MKYSPEIIGEIARRLAGRYVPTDVRNILESLESTDEQKALRADAERVDKLQEIFIKGEDFHIVMCNDHLEGSEHECEHETHPHFEAFDWSWRCEPVRSNTLRGVIDEAIDVARGE